MAIAAFAALAIALPAGLALAQSYPTRIIKLIVPFSPGGQPDTIARIVAQHLSVSVGTTIIDNRPGANTTIGAKAAIAAEPDGYTLSFGTSTSLAIVPATTDRGPDGYHLRRSGGAAAAHPRRQGARARRHERETPGGSA